MEDPEMLRKALDEALDLVRLRAQGRIQFVVDERDQARADVHLLRGRLAKAIESWTEARNELADARERISSLEASLAHLASADC